MRVFYVLPTFELLKRCVDERYTKAVQNTLYYRALVKAAKDELNVKQSESVRSKDIGEGNIAFVNSFSSVGFTEYPADEVIIDELDKCDQANILMADERLAHSDYRWQAKISNPTFSGFGIDAEFSETDKKEWFIKCPLGHSIQLDWFKHIVKEVDKGDYVIRDQEWNWNSQRDIYPICDQCGSPIDRNSPGVWISTATKHSFKSGYRLTKLFTGTVPYTDMMDKFIKAQSDDTLMQRFYNADLGQAYTAEGAKVSDLLLDECKIDYIMPDMITEGASVVGVDVGTMFHVFIGKVIDKNKIRAVFIGAVKDPEDVIELCKKYRVRSGIIDAGPEKRIPRMICNTIPGLYMCYYGVGKRDMIDPANKIVTVDRTAALDNVKAKLIEKNIELPKNAKSLPEFYDHMMASTRLYDKEANKGEGAYRWDEGSKPDHLFHAVGYALIALRLLIILSR